MHTAYLLMQGAAPCSQNQHPALIATKKMPNFKHFPPKRADDRERVFQAIFQKTYIRRAEISPCPRK